MNKMGLKSNEELINDFLNKKNIFAVVGVSRDVEKYGHKVYKNLKEKGYTVYPINPKMDEVLGDKCYTGLEELPEKPDVVNLVVPPKVTLEIVKECKRLNIDKVWMQPGSELEEAIIYCNVKDRKPHFLRCGKIAYFLSLSILKTRGCFKPHPLGCGAHCFFDDNHIDVLHDVCVMVEGGKK